MEQTADREDDSDLDEQEGESHGGGFPIVLTDHCSKAGTGINAIGAVKLKRRGACPLGQYVQQQDVPFGRDRSMPHRGRPSPVIRLFRIHDPEGRFSLAFPANQSDESSCAKRRQGFTTMTNREATTTENTPRLRNRARQLRREYLLEEGAKPEEGRAQGPESR